MTCNIDILKYSTPRIFLEKRLVSGLIPKRAIMVEEFLNDNLNLFASAYL